ncbi:hypothetical protein [Clostridium sporogenes]|nr:hypothetical protein [Clostridium sporogenes]EHN14640.1 hypothetical protein IYC_12724 [Clostridium sporogenes PA 3679]MDU4600192.1 hypothetical protein [Clostridium sporogenes]
MDKEYKNPVHHVRVAVIGTVISALVALLFGGMAYLYQYYKHDIM